MASFSGGVLDIPGLVPVNIGSSAPYPVPFAPQIKPQASPAPAQPNLGLGAGVSPGTTDGGSYSGIDQYTSTFGAQGDGQFASFPGYGSSSPDFFSYGNYAPEIRPAQLSGMGSVGLGGLGDRLSSIGNSPYLDNANYTQAGINALGMFSPFASIGAGILQGFNLLDPGEATGNALADLGTTPGALQSGTAWLANQANQLFGGTGMGREHTSGSAYDIGGDPWMGWDPAVLESLTGITDPSQIIIDAANQAAAGGDHQSGYGVDLTSPPPDPYSLTGNMWDNFMLGATFGGGRFDPPASDPMFSQTNWMGPGFGAADRGLNPNDTN